MQQSGAGGGALATLPATPASPTDRAALPMLLPPNYKPPGASPQGGSKPAPPSASPAAATGSKPAGGSGKPRGANGARHPPPNVDRVNISCNGVRATFMIHTQTIVCRCPTCAESAQGSRTMSPTEFERHSGMQASKKWRRSIKVDLGSKVRRGLKASYRSDSFAWRTWWWEGAG